MEFPMRYRESFDRKFAQGSAAVLAGRHHRDTPPSDGGRWGPTVIFRPDADCRARLEAVTTELMAVAGPGHWPTGSAEAVHITVRALQTHGFEDDSVIGRSVAALHSAAARSRPVRFHVGGLTMTSAGVMACMYPTHAADEFAASLGDELGDDGWFEASFTRDIWHATIVHFTGPCADPQALVEWVADRRDVDLGEVLVPEAELIRYRYNGRQPVRVPLSVATLGGAV